MYSAKEQFCQKFAENVEKICVSTLSAIADQDKRIQDSIGLNQSDLRAILKKITVALPDFIFDADLRNVQDEIIEYLSKEFIMFQCQEEITNPQYINHLENFIYENINDIYGACVKKQ